MERENLNPNLVRIGVKEGKDTCPLMLSSCTVMPYV